MWVRAQFSVTKPGPKTLEGVDKRDRDRRQSEWPSGAVTFVALQKHGGEAGHLPSLPLLSGEVKAIGLA